MTDQPAPKPCPHCKTELYSCVYDGGKTRWAHPDSDCINSRKFVTEKTLEAWNTRAGPRVKKLDFNEDFEGLHWSASIGNGFEYFISWEITKFDCIFFIKNTPYCELIAECANLDEAKQAAQNHFSDFYPRAPNPCSEEEFAKLVSKALEI